MSEGLRESLLSYQFSRKERTLAASSSTESPPSPGESVAHRSPLNFDRKRPQLSVRPRSSGDTGRQKIKIQLIEEKSDTRSSRSITQKSIDSRDANRLPVDQVSVDSFVPDRKSIVRKKNISDSPFVPYGPPSPQNEVLDAKQKTTRPLWTRTRSGGVWYLRQRDTSSHDGSSIRSNKSAVPRVEQSPPTCISILPLKPPARPQSLQTAPTNHIVIETPFGYHDDIEIPSAIGLAMQGAEGRRMSSIDVKRLFSAPLMILRRSRIEKSKEPSPSPAQTLSSTQLVNVPSHTSVTGGDHTAASLQKVSALLESYLRPRFVGRLRSCSHLTKSSAGSSELEDSPQSRTKALIGAFRIPRNHSTDHVAEHASSIFNLRMGSTPQNSPTEKSTYKIKRRPSAATEEFIKIDISVRGGTSYLPSEARRISTPPLPDDSQFGGKRGFFFDYNAARSDEVCEDKHISPQITNVEGQDHTSRHLIDNPTVPRSSSTKLQRSSSRKTAGNTKVGDWFDTQLADLDAMTSEDEVISPMEPEKSPHCKHECQSRLAAIMRQRYEAQLDYNIPEHLPNSPLCPRNPRYWRVKQQKGSQFRGCWMHGFGEYDVVPGLYK